MLSNNHLVNYGKFHSNLDLTGIMVREMIMNYPNIIIDSLIPAL